MFSKEIFALVGLSDNAISDINLADYFGVSVDYLLGRADNPEVNR